MRRSTVRMRRSQTFRGILEAAATAGMSGEVEQQPTPGSSPTVSREGDGPLKVRFPCPISGCTKACNKKDNLQQHVKHDHSIPVSKGGRFSCYQPSCKDAFYHRTALIDHLKREHNIDVGKQLRSTK